MFSRKRKLEERNLKKFNINMLPKVLLAFIFSFCPINNFKSICLVCKLFQKIIYTQTFLDLKLDNYAKEISLNYNFPQKEYYILSYYCPGEKETNLKKAFLPRLKSLKEKEFLKETVFEEKFGVVEFIYVKSIGFAKVSKEINKTETNFLKKIDKYVFITKENNNVVYLSLNVEENAFNDLFKKFFMNSIDFKNKSCVFFKKISNKCEGKVLIRKYNKELVLSNYKNGLMEGKHFYFTKNIRSICIYSKDILKKKVEINNNPYNFSIINYNKKSNSCYMLNNDGLLIFKNNKDSLKGFFYHIFFDGSIIFCEKKNDLINGRFFMKKNQYYIKGKAFRQKSSKKILYEDLKYFEKEKEKEPLIRVKDGMTYFILEKDLFSLNFY